MGQRRGEPLTDGDVELLTVITREAELAHANRQLLDEVAVSLEQLQARARSCRSRGSGWSRRRTRNVDASSAISTTGRSTS